MIKIFEQYCDIDPYGEENWEPVYTIMKSYATYNKKFQKGVRYYLMRDEFYMVKDFNTLRDQYEKEWRLELSNLEEEDKKKIKSNKYYITNGQSIDDYNFQKIKLKELIKNINIEL
jgi:hypothetical protein